MKQMKYFFVALLSLFVTNMAWADDDKPITVNQLPEAVKTFVGTNFQSQKIVYAEKEGNTYECLLENGTKIEFNKRGKWKAIDCKSNAVPAKFIPKTIQKYVGNNFANAKITKIEKEHYGHEVELSNDIDLRFNHKGILIGMDD